MNSKVSEYLEDKENNILFEKLLFRMRKKYDIDFETDEQDLVDENSAVSRVYRFSNELLDEVFSNIHLRVGRALVVGSSGDQALHSVLAGAKEVTIMDGNMWAKPFVELKLAAIKNLDYEKFMVYFSHGLENLFYHRYYSKVSHDLSEQSRAFWDTIMLECSEDISSDVRDNFINFDTRGRDWKFHSFYSSEEKYNELKEKLGYSNIDFVVADISNFPSLAKGKYDLIMLSNIFDYSPYNYFSVVDKLYDNNLAEDGKMQIYYAFRDTCNTNFLDEFKDFFDEKYDQLISSDEYIVYDGVDGMIVNTNHTLHKLKSDEGMEN